MAKLISISVPKKRASRSHLSSPDLCQIVCIDRDERRQAERQRHEQEVVERSRRELDPREIDGRDGNDHGAQTGLTPARSRCCPSWSRASRPCRCDWSITSTKMTGLPVRPFGEARTELSDQFVAQLSAHEHLVRRRFGDRSCRLLMRSPSMTTPLSDITAEPPRFIRVNCGLPSRAECGRVRPS